MTLSMVYIWLWVVYSPLVCKPEADVHGCDVFAAVRLHSVRDINSYHDDVKEIPWEVI